MYNIFAYTYTLGDVTDVTADFLNAFEQANKTVGASRYFTARCAFVYDDATHMVGSSAACHSCLSGGHSSTKKLKYVLSFMSTPHSRYTDDEHKQFINWMVNDSPYKDAFIIKDPELIFKKYWTLNPFMPANEMVGAAIATRFLTEGHNSGGLGTWLELVKMGCDPSKAFAFAHLFPAAEKIYPIQYSPRDSHNVIYFQNIDPKNLANFVQGKKINPIKPYVEMKGYRDIEALWGNKGESRQTGTLASALKPKKVTYGISYNIFENAPRKSLKSNYTILTNKDDLKSVFDQFSEIIDKAA